MKKANFERLIKKTFLSLETKFGFKKIKTEYHSGGVIVCFQNPTTEVILNYEIGEFPWVTIADINNPEIDRTSLDWLLVELGERKTPTTDEVFLPARMDDAQLEVELQKRSAQLLRFGADFLKGDFTLLPKLQKRAEDYLAECKKIADRYTIKS
ncbi:MAG: hypothetical protein B5M51_04565 [Anaerolinea sp. 4484_236]|nr:MAG: hypothetical protein B5M51_04565 [Anaerolinea sp. 4484_236]